MKECKNYIKDILNDKITHKNLKSNFSKKPLINLQENDNNFLKNNVSSDLNLCNIEINES